MQTENTTTSGDNRRKPAGKKSKQARSSQVNARQDDVPFRETDQGGEAIDEVASAATEVSREPMNGKQETAAPPVPATDWAASLQDEWASAPMQKSEADDQPGKESGLVKTGSRLIKEVDQLIDRKRVKGAARDAWHSVATEVRQRADQVDRNVKKKPYAYVLGALGVGVALAKIIL